jgi:hypothetical protein
LMKIYVLPFFQRQPESLLWTITLHLHPRHSLLCPLSRESKGIFAHPLATSMQKNKR